MTNILRYADNIVTAYQSDILEQSDEFYDLAKYERDLRAAYNTFTTAYIEYIRHSNSVSVLLYRKHLDNALIGLICMSVSTNAVLRIKG